MNLLLELVDAAEDILALDLTMTSPYNIQFLEVAICNVMAAPIRHSIELQAM